MIALDWFVSVLVNGTLFAALVWIASVTCLRAASGRLMSLVWLAALAQFMWWRPIAWPSQPLSAASVGDLQLRAADASAGIGLLLAYLAIVGLLWARLLWGHVQLRGALMRLEAADPILSRYVHEAAAALRLRTIPELRMTDERVAPYSVGPLRPLLVLPRFLCEPGPRLHAILLHELAHIARRDHVVLWIERAIRSVFFFWPPVHFVANKLGEARELACDERAIASADLCPVEYARVLVEVMALTRAPRRSEVLAMGRGARLLSRRVERILAGAWSRPLRAAQQLALLLLTAAAVVGVRFETLRVATSQDELALPACDGSAMSPPPPTAAGASASAALQCGS